MSNIVKQIEQEISKMNLEIQNKNVGIVRSIADGVVRVEGLSGARFNELVEFKSGLYGLAMNLEETEVGLMLLGASMNQIKEGDECWATGKLLEVPVGEALLGRVVDCLGNPLDGKGEIHPSSTYPVEKIAPSIVKRKPVSVPVQTGILAIDAMIPIGRGQRELIIGDRSTGKTTIAIDTIISQSRQNKVLAREKNSQTKPLYCVYVAIGQKLSNIARIVGTLEKEGALEDTIIVSASASSPAAEQFLAPYAGCAMAEYLMDQGKDVLIVYDDLSKHAVAYRQVSLVLKRPSGREAYPGDVFYLHSRLLERSAQLSDDAGGGSLTALPIIETQAGDVSAYIPTNVISITDGQIFLETDLFYQGIRPAISVGLSVSRVGSAAQTKAIKKVSGTTKLDLAQFRELQAFSQFGSDLDEATKSKIERGERIVEVFKQDQYHPLSLAVQVVILWAMQNAYLDDVEVAEVQRCESAMIEFFESRKASLLQEISESKELNEGIVDQLKQALADFKSNWK